MSWCIDHNDVYESYDITILNIYGADYCCIINGIGKSKAVYLFKNVDLSEKSGIYKRWIFYHI